MIENNNLRIEYVSFSYDNSDKCVLKDVNFDITSGEFVCILGKSGCGKSTLLRLLAGLELPTNGKIYFGDSEIKTTSLDRGVVFQDYGLFPWMTAGENILLALSQYYKNKSKIELKKIAIEGLKKVGLSEEVYNMLPKHLSGGMRQRCAIAQVISTNPSMMLMDEPFGALDAVTRAKLQDLIIKLWTESTEQKTVVFVTHDVDEALLLANRIIVLGQTPSYIIYDKKINFNKTLDRNNIFYDEKVIEIRNELIKVINKDVNDRV